MRSITSILLSNLLFTILQPGVVVILIPYLIIRNQANGINQIYTLANYLGLLFIVCGVIILLRCILQFAYQGRGTLSPVDPTKKLVIGGLYRFSRNPMYFGVLMILTGEWLIFQIHSLLFYICLVFIIFHSFIYFYEEPVLKKEFGEEYKQYCEKVKRWI